MKVPVEHVKVSVRGREILIKIKRITGIEHWNEICRMAVCRSLAIPGTPPKRANIEDSNIDMDWKTFAGQFHQEFAALTTQRAQKDNVNITNKAELAEYFRDHLERGIHTLQNIKNLSSLLDSQI